MKKHEVLVELTEVLPRLITLLSLDSSSIWTETFKYTFEVVKLMLDAPFECGELAKLSASIRHIFGGMGSFNDYEPSRFDPTSGRYVAIVGTEDFDALRQKVYELAIALIEQ